MYEEFATLYDVFMADVPYADWVAYLDNLLIAGGYKGARVLDMATGTGRIAIGLQKLGYHVLGADNSPDMLGIAQGNARNGGAKLEFIQMDMTDFSLVNPVNAICCMCDGVNYVDGAGAKAFFSCAYGSLVQGGMLLFDISTPYRLEHILGNNTYGEEAEAGAYLLETFFEENACHMDLTLFLKEADGRYRRAYEEHVLYAHRPADLLADMEAAGFSQVGQYAFLTKEPAEEDTERILLYGIK
ncbi:class I SAM-dependent methyltransferase [Eubacteriales bacterium OttesenSCG-928-M02]|nr:class I SAM-dependent methyltransferase [Eubacteriales bacterium OttesenSCG-928-M02]